MTGLCRSAGDGWRGRRGCNDRKQSRGQKLLVVRRLSDNDDCLERINSADSCHHSVLHQSSIQSNGAAVSVP